MVDGKSAKSSKAKSSSSGAGSSSSSKDAPAAAAGQQSNARRERRSNRASEARDIKPQETAAQAGGDWSAGSSAWDWNSGDWGPGANSGKGKGQGKGKGKGKGGGKQAAAGKGNIKRRVEKLEDQSAIQIKFPKGFPLVSLVDWDKFSAQRRVLELVKVEAHLAGGFAIFDPVSGEIENAASSGASGSGKGKAAASKGDKSLLGGGIEFAREGEHRNSKSTSGGERSEEDPDEEEESLLG